jgi:hypothetical protein
MRTWLGVLIAVAGCKHAEKKPAPAPAPEPAKAAAAPAPKRPAPTKQQLADYKKHLKAGWALQKEQKWAESVPELEAALVAIPLDQRALAELGWSAMNAGDYTKAKRIDDQAVKVAIDPKVRASALYNLGTVYAKTGETERARAAFTLSLALRPNKTVEADLVKLGAKPAEDKPMCSPGQAACDCVIADAFPEVDRQDPPACAPADSPVPGFAAYKVTQEPWSYTYLLDEHQGFVALIGTELDRMRVDEELTVDKADVKTVGGHKVLWLQTKDHTNETSPLEDDAVDIIDTTTVAVTLCVFGDAATPTKCPLRDIPIASSSSSLRMNSEGTSPGKDGRDRETKVDVAIADDGTATIKLVSGPSDERLNALIGPHKLW